ncbi:MAG: 3-phosphoglycerate dehydrogenase family protein [Nitrosomonas sp.]|uniref:3-phosphoglycerate dehydrogenase family protein n=1 Tax=Nitrosomonas sp. TaxID=42353 RepID=UPI0027341D53|nr:3-phosphoglycerate dehydrogenase family protein [Nitrosomonas sp.]MDP1934399.1 3-phosphoglycerate dehydrogenase family protein [Nitrosomonas sp.]MDP3282586.1 3-phosphoglycerate dehydrogenase family protein [Nitrosomonas sp.]MDP3664309.1 3-phosphoglycerate dehydrogenase family protein [Nitrosomonas sp.]MDZ4107456.1 3-phosphoglycerate dehydrogenase family protein [Nitrosomonas sp.]
MPEHQDRIFKILTINQISPLGLNRFPADYYQVGSDIAEPDAILVRSQNLLNWRIPGSVKAIGRAGAGTNNIPVPEMNARGIPVFNTPGANANAVKELVLAGMLLAARNLVPALQFVDIMQGDDVSLNKQAENEKKRFSGIELPGRTLGIIGLGEIGRLVANAAIKLGMKVIGYDPKITVDSAWSLSAEVKKAHSMGDLLRHSEFVTVHIPLLDSTHHLIDEKHVKMMNPNVILLNFSRGAIVDEDAILAGIAANKIKYYVCDFPSQKLQHQKAVVTLPHLGASTLEAEENCAVMVVNQLIDHLQNGSITNTVNFPDIYMERESPYRVAVANANVPNILGQISTSMAKAGLNIHNMINKSRGEMAYTLADVDSPVPQHVVDEIAGITGVLMARYLPLPR